MKKHILALCTVSLAFCLAACGRNDNDTSESHTTSDRNADTSSQTSVSDTM